MKKNENNSQLAQENYISGYSDSCQLWTGEIFKTSI